MKERLTTALTQLNGYGKKLKAFYVRRMQKSFYRLHTCSIITMLELDELDAIIERYINDNNLYNEMIIAISEEN